MILNYVFYLLIYLLYRYLKYYYGIKVVLNAYFCPALDILGQITVKKYLLSSILIL